MKTIIAGGRDFEDVEYFLKCIENEFDSITEIVSGRAKGADTMGEILAVSNNVKIKKFPAQWDKYGKAAGSLRNKEMAEYADALIAFWDGRSTGTYNMIQLAKKLGLKVTVYNY